MIDFLFYSTPFLLILMALVLQSHFCSHPEKLINYGNEEYRFVLVSVGSGRSEELYAGTIKTEDYEKWVNGETGTIFVYSTRHHGRGWRVNLAHVTHISNYGSAPSFLPTNFF